MDRNDTTQISSTRALWWGLAFSFFFTGAIWWAGAFWMDGDRYADFSPRRIASVFPQMWYLWQLNEPTVWTRATAWGGYIAHNLFIWWLIWRAQSSNSKYSANLHWFNVWALLGNAFFIVLHLLQTRYFYDGLAQDVAEFTSQASVTLMLVAILIMENKRRGMFFGKRAPFLETAGKACANITAIIFPGRSSIPSGITRWKLPAGICSGFSTCSCSCCRAVCSIPAHM